MDYYPENIEVKVLELKLMAENRSWTKPIPLSI